MFKTALVIAFVVGGVATIVRPSSVPARATDPAPVSRPNVIVIVADDLGYGDTSAYGSTVIRTPNIDALAKVGVRFTNAYVTHPVCAPSRAGLVTGRYQERFGYEFNPVGRDDTGGVSLHEITIAQVMKSAGYATGMIGKWHLGQAAGYYPSDRGFDEYFGVAGGGSTYIVDPQPGDAFFSTAETEASTTVPSGAAALEPGSQRLRLERARARFPVTRNHQVVRVDNYLTDAFTDEATAFIDRHAASPFFLYMAYTAPHTPLQAPKKYVDRFASVADKGTRVYAAMVSALDDGVGRIAAKLKDRGLDRNTLIIFLSDNGCAGYLHGACSNGALSGYKGLHLEGGIRIPFIVSMPGRIPSGKVDDRVVSSLDILPTAAALGGASLPADRAYDGVNLMPYLAGINRSVPNPVLYWRAGTAFAVRDGNLKMWLARKAPPGSKPGYGVEREVTPGGEEARRDEHVMLYDLRHDAGERHNLAAAQPAQVAKLRARLTRWNRQLVLPQWPSARVSYHAYDGQVLEVHD